MYDGDTQSVHTGFTYRVYIPDVHTDCAYGTYIPGVHTDCTYGTYIPGVNSAYCLYNYTYRACILGTSDAHTTGWLIKHYLSENLDE